MLALAPVGAWLDPAPALAIEIVTGIDRRRAASKGPTASGQGLGEIGRGPMRPVSEIAIDIVSALVVVTELTPAFAGGSLATGPVPALAPARVRSSTLVFAPLPAPRLMLASACV